MLICDSYANNIKKAYDIKTATIAYAHHAALSGNIPAEDHEEVGRSLCQVHFKL